MSFCRTLRQRVPWNTVALAPSHGFRQLHTSQGSICRNACSRCSATSCSCFHISFLCNYVIRNKIYKLRSTIYQFVSYQRSQGHAQGTCPDPDIRIARFANRNGGREIARHVTWSTSYCASLGWCFNMFGLNLIFNPKISIWAIRHVQTSPIKIF